MTRSRIGSVLLAFITVLAASTLAFAADLVRLKGGTEFRGEVTNVSSTDGVTIRLDSGTSQTFSLMDIDYFGPEADAPSYDAAKANPQPTPAAPEAVEADAAQKLNLDFVGKDKNLTLYELAGRYDSVGWGSAGGQSAQVRVQGAAYEAICSAPCTFTAPPGTLNLAIGQKKGSPVELENLVTVDADGELVGKYTDNSGIRWAGWGIGIGGGLGGGGLLVAGLIQDDGGVDWALAGSGIGVSVASLVAAWVMTSIGDEAEVEYSR